MLNLVLSHGIPHAFRDGVYVFIPSTAIGLVPSLSAQLHSDGVHRREVAGAGAAVLKAVPVTVTFSGYHHGPLFCAPPFPTPTVGTMHMCVKERIGAGFDIIIIIIIITLILFA